MFSCKIVGHSKEWGDGGKLTDFLETYYHNRCLSLPSLIGSLVSFLVAYSIALKGGTILEIIFGGIISGLIVWYVTYVFMRTMENNKSHRKDIVFSVLVKLSRAYIKRDDFTLWKDGFHVSITGLNEIEGQKRHKQAIEHLKAYENTYNAWIDSKNKI